MQVGSLTVRLATRSSGSSRSEEKEVKEGSRRRRRRRRKQQVCSGLVDLLDKMCACLCECVCRHTGRGGGVTGSDAAQ